MAKVYRAIIKGDRVIKWIGEPLPTGDEWVPVLITITDPADTSESQEDADDPSNKPASGSHT